MRFFSIRVRDNGSFHWNKMGAREFKEGKKEREGGRERRTLQHHTGFTLFHFSTEMEQL